MTTAGLMIRTVSLKQVTTADSNMPTKWLFLLAVFSIHGYFYMLDGSFFLTLLWGLDTGALALGGTVF